MAARTNGYTLGDNTINIYFSCVRRIGVTCVDIFLVTRGQLNVTFENILDCLFCVVLWQQK